MRRGKGIENRERNRGKSYVKFWITSVRRAPAETRKKESGVAVTFTLARRFVFIYQDQAIPGDGASCHNWRCDIIGVCGEVNDEIGAIAREERKKKRRPILED